MVSFFISTFGKNKKMSLENMLSQFEQRASNAEPIGGKLKFEVDGVGILIDGTGTTNIVSASDAEADCTIKVSTPDLHALINGQLNAMSAFMGGKITVDGDMGVAMKLQELFGS